MANANDSSQDTIGSERADGAGTARVSFLEQALWKQFGEAKSHGDFARSWLGIQCSLIPGVECGVVVLGEADNGPFAPVAHWPVDGAASEGLTAAAELALTERRGVAQGQDDPSGSQRSLPWFIAYPIIVDGHAFGVAALEIEAGRRGQLRTVMRQLQWGVGWLEVMLRRDHLRSDRAQVDRMSTAFDLVAVALEHHRFQDACNAVMTELAMQLACDQASIGFLKGHNVAVVAISHAAQFGQRMNLVRTIGAAMDEAVDQKAMVMFPVRAHWDFRIDRAHKELARTAGAGNILTVPLHSSGVFFGAITLERPADRPFTDAEVALFDCVAGVVGPILEEKRQNDRLVLTKLYEALRRQLERLFGPRYFGRKIAATAAAIVITFFAFAKQQYDVTALASIEGSVQRSLVAPFEGYIANQYARAGDIVTKGELMATLDDKDLLTERLKWTTKRAEQLTEYGKALAKQERADAQIIMAQIEQAKAHIELLDEEIKRTEIRAPFDGAVISGDLSRSVGVAVKRGDELFQVAPLDSYRVALRVDERDIVDISPGQVGVLLVTSVPLKPLNYVVRRVTPIAEVEEGLNTFRVEAELNDVSDRLRPGMKGVGKTRIGERLIIRIWTQRLTDWIRLAIWKWLP